MLSGLGDREEFTHVSDSMSQTKSRGQEVYNELSNSQQQQITSIRHELESSLGKNIEVQNLELAIEESVSFNILINFSCKCLISWQTCPNRRLIP